MPGRVCAVLTCSRNSVEAKKGRDEGGEILHFFRFPANPELRNKWLKACKRKGHFNADTSVVCSDHFLPTDFAEDLRYKLGFTKKRLLKKEAVPSQKLSPDQAPPKLPSARKLRQEARERKEMVEQILKEAEKKEAENKLKAVSEEFKLLGKNLKKGGDGTNQYESLSTSEFFKAISLISSKRSNDEGPENLDSPPNKKIKLGSTPSPIILQKTKIAEGMKSSVEKGGSSKESSQMSDSTRQGISCNTPLKIVPHGVSPQLRAIRPAILSRKGCLEVRPAGQSNEKITTDSVGGTVGAKPPGSTNKGTIIIKPIPDSLKPEPTCPSKDLELAPSPDYLEILETVVGKYNSLLADHELYKRRTQNEIETLKKEVDKETQKYLDLKEAVSKTLSPNQISVLLNEKKRVGIWPSEDLHTAYSIRYNLGKRTYFFLRDKLNYPLPGLSTLRRWAGNLQMKPGTLENAIQMMDNATKHMSVLERVAVVSFGEVKVEPISEFDKVTNKVVGPHSQMLIVMVRGLFHSWKQPIYADFDRHMTCSLLTTLLEKLWEINIRVVAVVSSSSNASKATFYDLGATYDNPFFDFKGNTVYRFIDSPHLLKVMRNHFLINGFTLNDGMNISADCVKSLIEESATSDSTSNLKRSHINIKKHNVQNLDLATDLFSHSTADALRKRTDGDEMERSVVADFIDKICDWFDVFYSHVEKVDSPLKCGFGVHLDMQKEVLYGIAQIISEMKLQGKTRMTQFQQAILMNIESLFLLYDDIETDFNERVLLTRKLSLDLLADVTCILKDRKVGKFPGPLDALDTLRSIVIGRCPEFQKSKQALKGAFHEYFLMDYTKKDDLKNAVKQAVEKPQESSDQEDLKKSLKNRLAHLMKGLE